MGGVSLFYDASGNVIQKGNDLYLWDDSNRMKRAEVPQGLQRTVTVENIYDAGGNRVLKKSNKGYTFYVSPFFDIQAPIQTTSLMFV